MAWAIGGIFLANALPLFATDEPEVAFFESKIRPVLVEHCYKCHSADSEKIKGGLRVDSRDALLKGGDSGPALIPGEPEKSLLIKAIRYLDPDLKMPPRKDEDKKLADAQIADILLWVGKGAIMPATTGTVAAKHDYATARTNWAFHKPIDPPVPGGTVISNQSRRATGRSLITDSLSTEHSPAIDAFLGAKFRAKGLKPSPQADKTTLIRRATFDLIGLPPTLEEIDAFLNDHSTNAFARVVERLLASPRYGEKWGRHWLDVVRYTDSFDSRGIGGEADVPEAWRYRDWVVNAFNSDMPYDRFITHQIAGDILATNAPGKFDTNALIATGVFVIGEWGTGDADKEKMLTDIVDDQIDVTSRGFLGLTMACARCHDHKFDPISTDDYYGMAGIFFSSHILPNPGAKTAGSPVLRIPLVSSAEFAAHNLREERNVESEFGATASPMDEETVRLERARKELAALDRKFPVAHALQEGGTPNSAYKGFHDARVMVRGKYDRLGDVVPRHFPHVIAESQAAIRNGSGRLELARWIASKENPLTARVMVNRIWQHHFGEGIVRTPNNFGKLGTPPTHPELLDWLAHRFMDSGWSIKAMHRLMMNSAAYQQTATGGKKDPDNLFFARMNGRRLEAEEIRDALLAVTGQIDLTMGGPAINDLNTKRRTLYVMTIRSDKSNYRSLFDAPDAQTMAEKRVDSTVAPQALFLLNSPFALAQANALAERVTKQNTGDDAARVNWLYHLLYGRRPRAKELELGLRSVTWRDELHESQSDRTGTRGARPSNAEARLAAWQRYCQVLLCANEFIFVD